MGTAFAAANLGCSSARPSRASSTSMPEHRLPSCLGRGWWPWMRPVRAFLLPELEPVRGPRLPFRQLMSNPIVRLFAGAMALGSGLWALLESTLPLDMDHRLALSPSGIGLCFAAAALAHTFLPPLMGQLSDRIGRVKVLRMGLVLALVLLPLPALLPKTWMVVLARWGWQHGQLHHEPLQPSGGGPGGESGKPEFRLGLFHPEPRLLRGAHARPAGGRGPGAGAGSALGPGLRPCLRQLPAVAHRFKP